MKTISPALLLSWVLLVWANSSFAQEAPRDLGDQVRNIFIAKCAECHSKTLRKAKGGFGFVEDLARVRKEYSKDVDLTESDIWYFLSDVEDDDHMPPAKAKNGQLTTSELATIRWWVMAGAPDASQPLESSDPVTRDEEQAEETNETNLIAAFHPLLIHFPIALIMVAVLFELLRARSSDQWRAPLQLLLALVVVSGLLAGTTGFQAQDSEGYSDDTVAYHQWSAIAGTSLAACASVLLYRKRDLANKKATTLIFRILLLASALLISFAGHEGGLLVYEADHFG